LIVALSGAPVARAADDAAAAPAASAPGAPSLPPPVQMTGEQDHQRMMDVLGIKELRRGADGFDKTSPYYQNVDESKASVYTNYPDPLVMNDGTPVKTANQWWKKRRPEIVEDFDREVYGRVPAHTPKVTWEVASVDKGTNGDVPIVTKHLIGHVDNSAYPLITVNIDLTLTTPANAPGPVPVMMEFGFSFPAGFRRPGGGPGGAPAGGPPRNGGGFGGFGGGGPQGPTWQQQCLAKGWGYAILNPTSYQADNGAGLTQGIIGLCNHGQPRKADDWGALRAWAWGASRAMDYFKTDRAVNAKMVGIEGLSRYGKATLVTMAYEPRLAVAFVGSSGEGGAKLYRRNYGETIENVESSGEYHWMAGNFMKYAGPKNAGDLPVDAHELIAMCAPRPVFISCGSPLVEGTWVDDKGMFLAAVYASPVYTLLGKQGLSVTDMPPMETSLIDGDLAFRQHAGAHTTGPNWPTFIVWASHYLKAPGNSGAQATASAQ
jgi:hypothetical protein